MSDDFFDDLSDIARESDSETESETAQTLQVGLSKLASLIEDLNCDLYPPRTFEKAMSAAIELTGAERGFLVLVSETGEWSFRVARNMDTGDIENAEAAASHTVIRKVLEGRQPILINDVVGASDISKQQSIAKMQVRSIMGAPLIAKGKLLGAAYVDTTRLAGVFDQTSLALFKTFVHLAAVALENARLIEAEQEASARNLELQEYLNSVLHSQPYGLIIFDSDMQIEYVNPQAQTLLRNNDFFPTCKFTEGSLADEQTELLFLSHLEEFIRTGDTDRHFWDGSGRSIAYTFFKVQNNRNQKNRVGLILEDITLQRQLEQRLIESEKRSMVNQLAGGIAHEINNSLQPVKGHVELLGMILKRDGLLDGYGKEIETVGSLITRIEKIVKNLRHLSKPAKPEQEELDFVYLIRSTVEMLENTTGMFREFVRNDPSARFRINLDLEENLPAIIGDSQGLEGMLINLILNSTHAIKEKNEGELTIRAHGNGAGIMLIVKDTGSGIKPDVLPHVFEPYFTTKADCGTGLGMCIVQNVAEIHNAKLDLASEYGKGTTITLTFPAMTKV